MKNMSFADNVGEARSDLAWQHVINPGFSNQDTTSQEAAITGFVKDNSGLIVRFIRGRSLRSEVCDD